MATLRERGRSLQAIANHFTAKGTPISASAVGWQCLRVGADAPIAKRNPLSTRSDVYRRGGHVIRPFTPDEDARLRDLEAQGLKTRQMADQLGRRENSIRGRLMTLARHDARAEDESLPESTNGEL
ncbi:hypothetical protein ACFQ15_05610 [Sphingomonas hankookensis]